MLINRTGGGSENLNTELTNQESIIDQMQATMNNVAYHPQQERTVTAQTVQMSVLPDNGYVLSKVLVNPTPSHSKNVTPSDVEQTVTPDEGKLLSSVVVGASDKSGIYVWKRAEQVSATESVTNPSYVSTPITAVTHKLDTTTYPYLATLMNYATFFGSMKITFSNDYEINLTSSGGKLYGIGSGEVQHEILYENGVLTMPTAFGDNGSFTISGTGTFTANYTSYGDNEFIVDDNQNKYPDGDTQDGYYYERNDTIESIFRMFGYSNVALDTYTPSSDIGASGVNISHTLGVAPKIVLIYTDEDIVDSGKLKSIVATAISGNQSRGSFVSYGSNNAYGTTTFSSHGSYLMTESHVTFYISDQYKANITYNVITIG